MTPEPNYEETEYKSYEKARALGKYEMLKKETGTTINEDILRKLCNEYQSKEYFCRLCGNKQTHDVDVYELCKSCSAEVVTSMMKTFIEKVIEVRSKEQPTSFCTDCKKHFNACKCEKTEALRKLRK